MEQNRNESGWDICLLLSDLLKSPSGPRLDILHSSSLEVSFEGAAQLHVSFCSLKALGTTVWQVDGGNVSEGEKTTFL